MDDAVALLGAPKAMEEQTQLGSSPESDVSEQRCELLVNQPPDRVFGFHIPILEQARGQPAEQSQDINNSRNPSGNAGRQIFFHETQLPKRCLVW